ncbi:MAG: GNAT family N-acetyltransferase [Eubacteriales bacterium]
MMFVFPCEKYKQKATEFIQEFYDFSSQINGTGGLDRYLKEYSYSEWLTKVLSDIDIANIPEGRVPAYTYFYVREDDEIVGMINIRLALNDFLRKEGGHIGYCIRPTERRKGYGTKMLRESLGFCKTIGLNEIIISCDKNNLASAGVIIKCGGLLDAEFYSETFNEVIQRYRIM